MATIKNVQIVDIATKCSSAVYDVLLNHPDFYAYKFDVGANDICDVVLNNVIDLLNGNYYK